MVTRRVCRALAIRGQYFENDNCFLTTPKCLPSGVFWLVLIGLVGFLRPELQLHKQTAERCKGGNMDEEQHYMRFSNDEYEGGEYIGEVHL